MISKQFSLLLEEKGNGFCFQIITLIYFTDATQVKQMSSGTSSLGGIRDDDEDNEDGTVLEGSADMPLDIWIPDILLAKE